jgi:methionyl-tRNA synthetase
MKRAALFTTPIYYVNGKCHIGHLHTQFLTEATALWWCLDRKRQNGNLEKKKFHFSTGTDEHGLKIQQEALKANIQPEEFCRKTAQHFKQVFDFYKLRYTNFIRTSDPDHVQNVQKFWGDIKQDIYIGEYNGWYCVSDEAFVTDVYEVNGETFSKESNKKCEWLTEKNYKFRLSKYEPLIRQWLTDHPDVIQPKSRYNQVLAILNDSCKEDLSISRSSSRVKWAIEVPQDPSQGVYVWLDALTNYYTVGKSIGIWPPHTQVIGKDILKFHAIYWPAFLLAAGLELPQKLLVHGHWTVGGTKMSKSLGNVVDALEIGQKYGPDYVRYYLLRGANVSDDTDFSIEEFPNRVNELADNMGNLVCRIFSSKLHQKVNFACGELTKEDNDLIKSINIMSKKVNDFYCESNFREGILLCHDILRLANSYFEKEKPWKATQDRLENIKYLITEALRVSAIGLYPILPDKMDELLKYLGLSFENDIAIDLMKFDVSRKYTISMNPPILFNKVK